MTSRIGVGVMGVALLLYVVAVGWLAVMFFASGTTPGVAMGVGLAILAPIGAWALGRELVFGFQADRLGRLLEAEGGMPDDEVSLTPSGRVIKEEAGALVAKYAAVADEGWRGQFRLGVVQDAAGQRAQARASIREAIRRARAAPEATS